jgi:2-keto-3-deoxy-6-phosphogluconate aldolase
MNRDDTLQLIASTRVVAIVRSSDTETALQNAEAIVEGGLPVIEVSLTTLAPPM